MTTVQKIRIPEVKAVLKFDGNDVYEASTEPYRSSSPWIHSMETHETGSISMVVWNGTHAGEELINVAITPTDITQAFVQLVESGATHCSGYPIQDLDNADACTSDLVLQQAVYGSVIWG